MIQAVGQSGWEVYSVDESSGTKKEQVTELFLEYRVEILRMCFLYLKDYQLAEDAVQETYLKAYRFYDSFRNKSGRKTWLVRIATNVCKDMLKERKRMELSYDAGDFSAGEMHAEFLEQKSVIDEMVEKSVVSKAIMELEPEIREVILLYYYQELKLKEIAKTLDLPMTTVVYRQQKGKKELQRLLKEEKGGLRL